MIVDCADCAMGPGGCADCVVSALIQPDPAGVRLDPAELRALRVLADAGLVPRLRLVPRGLDSRRAA